MTVTMEVLALRTHGDKISVDLQGATKRQAEWMPMMRWTIEVPEYVGRKYMIGQILKFKVTR